MPTPRSESIRLSRSDELGIARSPALHGETAYKVDRYAHLARFIDSGVAALLDDSDLTQYVLHARSKETIGKNLAHLLCLTIETDEFIGIIDAHAAHGMPELAALVEGGIQNSVATIGTVYDRIEDFAGTGAAGLPGNARVIDRLAKMDLEQFNPYANVYLRSQIGQGRFPSHLARTADGFRFRPGYPHAALVPEASRYMPFDSPYLDESVIESSPMVRVGDIPASPATVGCPVTFNPRRMPELWNLYVSARENLGRRQRFGGNVIESVSSGGSAG